MIGSKFLTNASKILQTTHRRCLSRSSCVQFNQPLSPNEMCRPGGIASFMRLPIQNTAEGLDACFVGIPLDIGTSNRSGTRFGPRQMRHESCMIRPCNQDTGAAPFESLNVADVGDVSHTFYNLEKACEEIREHYNNLLKTGVKPLTLGGDHTITYPILQAMKEKHGPVALIHVDAHADVSETQRGARVSHGTPFRRAMEDGCLSPDHVIQIGLRGSGYSPNDYDYCYKNFWKVVMGKDCWYKSLSPLMEEVRQHFGEIPVYISFDIDALDPAYAPGTGTPEIAGLTPFQALEIIRGCRGLNVVGGDLVEVSPPFDTTGTTAIYGVNLLYEMLCVLPGVKYHPR